MSHVIAVPVGAGGSIVVEVDSPPDTAQPVSESVRSWRPSGTDAVSIESTTQTFEEALASLDQAWRSLRERFTEADEVTLELGLRFAGEGGLVVVKASAEAHLNLTLHWARSSP
jgi:hypothetical protein